MQATQSPKTSKKYYVVKTVTRVLTPDMTASGKQEVIQDKLYYYCGTWRAEWCKQNAQKLPLKKAKEIVLSLDNNNPGETFDWVLVK